VVEAFGRLTGRSRSANGIPYREVRLSRVDTLSGASLPRSFSGWIQTSRYPAPSAADSPGLWGLDGHLVAIVTRRRDAHTPLGPVLSIAPVVRREVILSPAGCWTDPSLATTVFNGKLSEVPRSKTYALVEQAGGLRAFPLRRLEGLLNR
jgi:hypothetical protein